jgi:two-component system cell cycle sensor histidine kinase/response regulator CckA
VGPVDHQHAILDAAWDAVIEMGEDGRVRYWNPRAQTLFGWTAEQAVGRPLVELIIPERHRQAHCEGLERFRATGEGPILGRRVEIDARRRDGSELLVELCVTRLNDVPHPSCVAYLRDLSEHQRAESALRASERRFRALIEHSVEAIALFARDGTILYGSPNTTSVLGYELDDFVGRNAFELIHHEDHGAVAAQLAQALGRPGDAVEVAARVRHKSGRWRVLEGIFTNLLDDPNVRAIVNNYRDVTERKHLEEQLRQSQKMEAVGRLAGGIAHDFNNLLTAILGGAALLRRHCGPEDASVRHIDEIRKAGERAAALTAQLLAFSRKQMLVPRVLDLNALVANLGDMLRRLIGEHIELSTRLHPEPAWVRVDPGQMEQVLVNLVVNARDAMPEGGRLGVSIEPRVVDGAEGEGLASGGYVRVIVSDTGVGMDLETLSHVFEPFFTTKEVGQGTGLGLATVYGILQQSGGSIFVDSVPGRGTTFRIYLPAVGAPEAPQATPSAPAALGGTETVLLVEDEEMVRDMTREMLELSGYRVLEAPNGAAAVEAARLHDGPIHLMLTDVVMPGMSGSELALRITAARPETKVLFASGYAADATVHRGAGLEPGLAFIAKPFSPEDLARKVREVLDRAH